MKRIETCQVECPNCHSKNLEYLHDEIEFNYDLMYYPFVCLDCKIEGRQVYGLDEESYHEAWVNDDGSFEESNSLKWKRIRELEKKAIQKYIDRIDNFEKFVMDVLYGDEQQEYKKLLKEMSEKFCDRCGIRLSDDNACYDADFDQIFCKECWKKEFGNKTV